MSEDNTFVYTSENISILVSSMEDCKYKCESEKSKVDFTKNMKENK